MILHVIGLILKIIGILLLVILGLVLLVIGIFLFVPLRYELQAEFPGKMEDITGRLKISWFLHLIAGRMEYKNGDLNWEGRLVWKKIGDTGEEKKTRREPEKRTEVQKEKKTETKRLEQKEHSEPKVTEPDVEKNQSMKAIEPDVKKEPVAKTMEPVPKKEQTTQVIEPVIKKESAETISKRTFPQKETSRQSDETEPELKEPKRRRKRKKPVKAFGNLIRKISSKITAIIKKIKYTFKKLCDKIKNIAAKKEKIMEFLGQDNHKAAWERGKKELVWIRRFLKPKKLRVKMEYGFEDPYHTGQMLAALSVLYAFTGEYMEIEPNFEKRMLKGNLYIKGKLRAFPLLMFGLKMILDKNVRSTYHDIRAFEL